MTATASAPGGRNGTSRPSFRPGADACTPSPTTRNRTRRASRGTGPRRAQTRAPRGHPLRQIRAAVPRFAVLGGGWDRAAILNQHALDHGGNIVIDINIATNFDIYDHRGYAELIGHLLLVFLGIIVTQPLYDS